MILVDIHEPEDIFKALAPLGIKENLPTGDYLFDSWEGKRVGIERKEVISDLLNSLGSGRLADQLNRLTESFDISILLMEGPIYLNKYGNIQRRFWTTEHGKSKFNVKDTGWTYTDVMLSTLSASIILGIIPLFVPEQKFTPGVIIELYRWFQKTEHGKWLVRPKSVEIITEQVSKMMLSTIPGIGPHIAEDILKELKTAQNVANTSLDILKSIKGVGDKRAANILKAFTDEFKEEI